LIVCGFASENKLEARTKKDFMGRVSDAKERLMDAVLELIWSGSYGSTTIDQICEKAGVKKGSFYYFFDSKSELAAEAFEESWKHKRVELDSIFSPTVPPLDRLKKYFDFGYEFQREIKLKHGKVLGCPQVTLGSEVCTQEDVLQKKIQVIMEQKRKYIESAIRDAHADGIIDAPDAGVKARMLVAYYEGLLTQARIQNDVEVLREAANGMLTILGVKEIATA
jgi:TetR/AcrR family transcriptional repressor of nem operon